MGKMIQCQGRGGCPFQKTPGHFVCIGMGRQQNTGKPVDQIELVFKIHEAVFDLDESGGDQQAFGADGIQKVLLGDIGNPG